MVRAYDVGPHGFWPHRNIIEGHAIVRQRVGSALLEADKRIGAVREFKLVQVESTPGVGVGTYRVYQMGNRAPRLSAINAERNFVLADVIFIGPFTVSQTKMHLTLPFQVNMQNHLV